MQCFQRYNQSSSSCSFAMSVIFTLSILFYLLVFQHLTYADQQFPFKKLQNYGNVWKSKMQTEITAKTAVECGIFCVENEVIVVSE